MIDNTMNDILDLLNDCIKKDLWFEIDNEDSIKLREYICKLEVNNNKLKRIKDICDSIPCYWTIVGTDKIHDIEVIIDEVSNN